MTTEIQTEFRAIADTFTEIKVSLAKLETHVFWLRMGIFAIMGMLLPMFGLLISLSVRR